MSTKNRKHPPRIGEKLFRFILEKSELRSLLGDYEELYKDIAQNRGRFIASLWYGFQILNAIPSAVWDSIKWRFVMIRNYLKTAFRMMKRQKVYTLLYIIGLSIGMTGCILIILYIQFELSYDRYHEDVTDIYRVVYDRPGQGNMNATTFGSLAPALMKDVPEVLYASRIRRFEYTISSKDHLFTERNFFFADPQFFDVFSFPLISGNPKTALNEPFSILITEKMAQKYFGSNDPLEKHFLLTIVKSTQ